MCKYFVNILSKGRGEGYKQRGCARILFYKVTMLFEKSGQSAIGSVQSIDVVINVKCISRCGDGLTAVHVSVHSLLHRTQSNENMD